MMSARFVRYGYKAFMAPTANKLVSVLRCGEDLGAANKEMMKLRD